MEHCKTSQEVNSETTTKIVYTICKVHLTDIAKGVFTNKRLLYKALTKLCNGSKMMRFSGIINYEHKTVNYKNVSTLLNVLLANESFYVNFVDVNDVIHVYEVKKINVNAINTY